MKILKYSVLILLAYLLISLTVSRLFMFYLNDNTNFLQNYIIKQNITDVEVDSVKTNWKGLYPSIKVDITNKNEKQTLKYPENIQAQINIYKSVIYLKPIIKSIYVEKINYVGELIDLTVLLRNNNSSNKFKIDNIVIENSNLNLSYKEKNYNFINTNISIRENNLNFESELDNNKKINFIAKNIQIENSELKNIDYQFEILGEFNYEFNKLLKKYNVKIKDSKLLIKSNGKYRQGNFQKSNISVKTIKNSNFNINGNTIKDLNLKLAFSGNIKEKFNFEVVEYSSTSENNNLYNFRNISGSFNFSNSMLLAYINEIRINTKKLFSDYNVFKINNFDFIGNIKKIKFKSSIVNSNRKIYFNGILSDTLINYNKSDIDNFSGHLIFNNDQAYIDIDAKNIKISNNNILNETLKFDSIRGKISIENFINAKVAFDQIELINKEIKLKVSGNVSKKNDSINILSSLSYIDMRYITKYLPKNFMSTRTASYFNNAFKEGTTNNGYISINGKLTSYPFYDDYSGISYAVFPIENLHMDYKSNWIPFENINGIAYFKNRSAFFTSQDFKVLKTKVSNSSLYIQDVKNTELLINGNLEGPLKDLIKYANKAKLSNISTQIYRKISGKATTDFNMKLAFNGNKNFYESKINLIDINYSLDNSNQFSNLNGILKFENNNFYTGKNEYMKGFYNDKKINFQIKTDLNKNFIISGEQKINFNDYIKNRDIKEFYKGNALWNYRILFPGFSSKKKDINIIATSNLEGMAINLPEPFKKSIDTNIITKISATFDQKNFKDISVSYNGMFSQIKSLKSLTGYIDFSGKKHNIPKEKFSLYGSIDKVNLEDWKLLNKSDIKVNYLIYLDKVNLKIKKFLLKKIILNNFSIIGSSSNNSFSFEKINVVSDEVIIHASGNVENNNSSYFKANLKSKSLQNLLDYWNIDHSLRDSFVESNFDLSWKGSLFDFSLESIYGKFSTSMKDGRIKKVGNRVSRIFGLFNIDLLAKRLSLDFDDVTKNGFYFNTLNGDFRIDNGNIFTTNLFIKGPSAEMLAVGTTDIINETYDMHVIASPEFGETLPAIALLGGPITAAATFAAEKLAKAFGKDINDLIKIKYKVSGSWDNPVIKIMDKNTDPLDSVEELFE